MSVLTAATAAVLFGIGTYLLLQRKLSRLIVGISLIGHGANVVFVTATRRGRPPFIDQGDPDTFADPMPQFLVLTAIVITFGVTALLLALAYRSWLLTEDDEVADDVDDRTLGRDGAEDTEVVDASGDAVPSGPDLVRLGVERGPPGPLDTGEHEVADEATTGETLGEAPQ